MVSQENPAQSESKFGTIGDRSSLRNLLDWAQELDLLEPLVLLLDGSRSSVQPQFIGTTLAYIRQKVFTNFLTAWEFEVPFLPRLRALAQASAVAPYIYEHHHSMPTAHSVAQQLRDGQLGKLPLIALIARPIHAQDEITEEWIGAIRAWCFIQFLGAIYSRAQPNPYLITVINKLRQAIDRDEEWLSLFARLKGPTTSFHGLTRHLSSAASSLLANAAAPVSRPAHRSMLAELHNFCEGKQPRSNSQADGENYGSFYREHLQADTGRKLSRDWTPYPSSRSEFQEDEDAQEVGTLNLDLNEEDADTWMVTDLNETDTPPEQERKAGGVLLASVEDSQLLPFSWNRPSPHERAVLQQWIASALVSDDEEIVLLAAMVHLAVHSARSLRTVLKLEISNDTDADWRIDLTKGCLHRFPPRRYNGWRADGKTIGWVQPIASEIQLALPVNVLSILQRCQSQAPSASFVGDLLIPGADAPEVSFRKICQQTKGLERITSGMLTHWLEQSAFEQSADPVLSQLVASQPRSGLPGACAYASFGLAQVRSVLQVTQAQSPADRRTDASGPMELNAAGSELSPIEELLRQACADACDRVNIQASDPTCWVEHHNCLTAYVTLALLAATGARPVNSPFETLQYIDLEAGVIFIEDKVSSRLHQGRLIPLARHAVELLRLHYLPHLKRLGSILSTFNAAMSTVVLDHAQGQANSALPLLFFLSSEPELGWSEVSETSLAALNLFQWPLPWNLMRHRLPTELRRLGVNPEIINGLTGHGEQGTAAYGPYSMRIWEQDAQLVLPKLDALLQRLKLTAPRAADWEVELAAPVPRPSGGGMALGKLQFGAQARQEQRRDRHARVKEQAERDIQDFIGTRPLDSLAPDDWEKLSQRMLLTTSGMPQAMGTLRYETLMHWINLQWAGQAMLPRLKRRYIPSLEEQSPFTHLSIGAASRVSAAREALDHLFSTLTPSRVSQRDSLIIGAASLLLHSRVSDMDVLRDVLASRNCRVLSFSGKSYLFHAQALDRMPSAPGRRFRIHPMAARLLDTGSYRLDVTERSLPPSLHGVVQTAGASIGAATKTLQCFEQLGPLVQQCNAQQMPGVVAAYLDGQVVTAALPLADWLRVELGHAVEVPAWTGKDAAVDRKEDKDDTDAEGTPVNLSDPVQEDYVFLSGELASGSSASPSDKRDAQIAAREFFQAIRQELNSFAGRKQSPRRDLDAALRRVISEHDKASRSCRMLGEWLRSMLWRRTRRGHLSLGSLLRYLNALSICFEAVAYDHDLLDCDGDEVTDFYHRVMTARRSIHPGVDDVPPVDPGKDAGASVSPSSDESSDRSYRTWKLALVLLRDFHRLVSREMGVEDPEWPEIDAGKDALSISPGIVLEQEYLHALRLAVPKPKSATHEQMARAFILLVCYRFGLRGAEVTGLMRDDWVSTADGSVVLLVRPTPVRALKTLAARRQVPLVFKLTALESSIVKRFFALWEGIAKDNPKIPLFVDPVKKDSLMNDKLLRWQATRLIKRATLNDDLSLHHLRHTFANRVAMLLLDGTDKFWPHLACQPITPLQREHARRLLLCTAGVTRRSLWALARLLGHAHPSTTVRSYLHLLPELSEQLAWSDQPLQKNPPRQRPEAGLNLDHLARRDGYLVVDTIATADKSPQRPGTQAVLRFLRLYQSGASLQRASFSVALEECDGARLVQIVEAVDQTLARRSAINPPLGGNSTLLSHIRDERWLSLIALAERFNSSESAEDTSSRKSDELMEMITPSNWCWWLTASRWRAMRAASSATRPSTTGSTTSRWWRPSRGRYATAHPSRPCPRHCRPCSGTCCATAVGTGS